jgi:hypothetical protein
MKNYKANYIDPQTFGTSEIETKIPVDLVLEIKQNLDKIEGYLITPTLIDPIDLSVIWGVMDSESKLKYKVTITLNN